MKKKLYIHIGWPKTGTSAIQGFLVDNYQILKDKYNLFYPDYGRWGDGSHHNIAFSLRENPYCKMKTEEEQLVYLNELKKLIIESKCTNTLLSSECFNLYDNENFKELFCEEFDITIICYLRAQDEYLESIYGQNVRDTHFKEQRTFKEYIEYFKDKLYYYKILNQWESITSPDNFIIRFYNKEYFINGNIIDDFLNIFSIKNNTDIFKSNKRSVNLSYTKETLEYKRLLNRILEKQDGKLIAVLQKFSLQNTKKQNYLTSIEKNQLNDVFKEDNLLIKDRYVNCNFTPSLSSNHSKKEEKIFTILTSDSMNKISKFIYDNDLATFQDILKSFKSYKGKLTSDEKTLLKSLSQISTIENNLFKYLVNLILQKLNP